MSLQEISTCVWFDLTNYPEIAATIPQQAQNGPFTQKIVFNPSLNQVKEIKLVAYEIFEPYKDQATLPFAVSTAFARDPYFIVSLDGLNVQQSHVLNGVSVQGAIIQTSNPNYLEPVSWIQPKGVGSNQDTGTLNEIIVRVSRPKVSLQTPVTNANPAAATAQTNQSPLFNRILLKFAVKRFGDQPIQSREGLPRAPIEELPDTFYADDRKIGITDRYNSQRNF